jgi:pyruvate dehydrogenase E2 component (dihydrolipoyllysine-residue acetyltransferase)
MAISVVMPALELTQETGKLVAWRKKEGESVAKGEVLLEVETDKAVVEIESPGDGLLAGVKAVGGDVVPVGATIAWLVAPGEMPPAEVTPRASARETTSPRAPEPRAVSNAGSSPAAPTSEARISPKARRLAKEHGVDLNRVRGSGPGGEILASDILAKESVTSSASASTWVGSGAETLSSVARLMAERTTQSWTTVPHFFVVREVDATALNSAREKLGGAIEQTHGVKLSHTDLLVALVARVLAKHPRVNSSWASGAIHPNADVNIGVAIAVDDGVVAAVISKADKATLGDIAVQRRDLAKRAKEGRTRPTDIAGATFTISNLGMYNVDAFTAIISPPQAAILAVGRIADRVVAADGRPAVRPLMTLSLSSDHRVIDGARAALFLNDLVEAILQSERMLA